MRVPALCMLAAACALAQDNRVGVDPRIELMAILFRLAGNAEYAAQGVPAYDQALDVWFAPYRNHRAIQIARELRQNYGIGYNAPMSLAVYLTDVDTLAERVPLDQPGVLLDHRWRVSDARRFLDAARQFVADSHFRDFLASQQGLLDLTDTRAQAFAARRIDYDWFSRFFGPRSVRMIFVPALVSSSGSYGVHMVDAGGVEEVFAIIGVYTLDAQAEPYFPDAVSSTIVHEFAHSYANPLVDAYGAQLDPAGGVLFRSVESQMRAQAYTNGRVVLYESLVRAATARYTLEHDGAGVADRAIQYEHNRSFLWTGEFFRALAQYERRRDLYPTLESFMPRVVDFFNYAAQAPIDMPARYEASRPKIVEWSIADGAADVDPALMAITVRFDRPMLHAYSILPVTFEGFPPIASYSLDDSATVCTIVVSLRPEHDYALRLNAAGEGRFASAEGVWLSPVSLAFRTKAADGPVAPPERYRRPGAAGAHR